MLDITGEDREAFLQGQCTNDVARLVPDGVLRAATLTPKGKLFSLFQACKTTDRLRLLVEPGPASRLELHLKRFVVFQRAALHDRSAEFARFDLYGATPSELPASEPCRVRMAEVESIGVAVWPGEGEVHAVWLVPTEGAARIEEILADHLPRVSDPEAEVRRIATGRPLFGIDMDESNLLDEVGLPDAVSTTKGCYVGQEIVARLRTYGRVNQRLVRFDFPHGFLPLPAALVQQRAPEKEAGRVTSAVSSPESGAIGLGYARREIEIGQTLAFRDDFSKAAIVRTIGS